MAEVGQGIPGRRKTESQSLQRKYTMVSTAWCRLDKVGGHWTHVGVVEWVLMHCERDAGGFHEGLGV